MVRGGLVFAGGQPQNGSDDENLAFRFEQYFGQWVSDIHMEPDQVAANSTNTTQSEHYMTFIKGMIS